MDALKKGVGLLKDNDVSMMKICVMVHDAQAVTRTGLEVWVLHLLEMLC